MKKLFITLAAVVAFAACSDDDDNHIRIPDPQGWAGTYGLGELTTGNLDYGAANPRPNVPLSGAFYIDWDTPDATPYNMGKLNAVTFRGILGIILPQVLNTVTLGEDGNITASYSSDAITFDISMLNKIPSIDELITGKVWLQSPKDLAYWSEQSGKLKVKLNVDAIIKQALEDSGNSGNSEIGNLVSELLENPAQLKGLLTTLGVELSDLTINTLLDWVKNGVPLNVKTANGHTYIYLDKGQLDMLFKAGTDGTSDFSKLMSVFSSLIPKEYAMIGTFLNMIPRYWDVTETFSIGLDLVKQ
mgnify:CR=1 FL=1